MTKKYVHRIYRILTSVMLVVTGGCLIAACLGIYLSGDQPFSPESVATAFHGIAAVVYLCLALVIGGFLLQLFYPPEVAKKPVKKQYATILSRLHSKVDLANSNPVIAATIRREQTLRKTLNRITLVLLGLGTGIFLCYALNSNNYHQTEINTSMIRAMAVFLPCLTIPFGCGVISAYCSRCSIKREIELLKQLDTSKATVPCSKKPVNENTLRIVRYALLCAALAIVLFGFFTGGTNDVLTKAINICTECVGLG